MKNKIVKIIIVVIILLLILTGVYFLFIKDNKKEKNISDEYTLVSKDNVFEYKTSEEIIKILEHGTGIVFLGFKECPWCQQYAKILDDLSKEEGIDVIYYYDIRKDREENNETYKKIVSILEENLDYDKEGNRRIYVPDVSFILSGEVVYHTNETSMIEGEVTPEEYWTDDKLYETKKSLTKYYNDISNSMCTSCNE